MITAFFRMRKQFSLIWKQPLDVREQSRNEYKRIEFIGFCMCVFLLIGNHRDVSYLSMGEDFLHVKAIKWIAKGKFLSIYKLVICHKYKRNIRLEIDKTLDDPKDRGKVPPPDKPAKWTSSGLSSREPNIKNLDHKNTPTEAPNQQENRQPAVWPIRPWSEMLVSESQANTRLMKRWK